MGDAKKMSPSTESLDAVSRVLWGGVLTVAAVAGLATATWFLIMRVRSPDIWEGVSFGFIFGVAVLSLPFGVWGIRLLFNAPLRGGGLLSTGTWGALSLTLAVAFVASVVAVQQHGWVERTQFVEVRQDGTEVPRVQVTERWRWVALTLAGTVWTLVQSRRAARRKAAAVIRPDVFRTTPPVDGVRRDA